MADHIHIFSKRDAASAYRHRNGCTVKVVGENLYGLRVSKIYDHREVELDPELREREQKWWNVAVLCRLEPEGEVIRA